MTKHVIRPLIVGAGVAGVLGAMIVAPIDAAPNKEHKVTICHRTNSITNPYVVIDVAQSSVDGSGANDKGQGDHFLNHIGEVWTPLTQKHSDWGDIIPPIPGVHGGLNWTAEGQAIWKAGCNVSAAVIPKSGDEDGDNIPDAVDPDDDGDGVPDTTDPDIDGDGVPNVVDPDVDGDGTPNESDPDVDNDGMPDTIDPDDDNDGVPDTVDPTPEGNPEPDSTPRGLDPDSDDDGTPDSSDPDDDNDGTPDTRDGDANGDGIPETNEQVVPRIDAYLPDQITDTVTQIKTRRLVTNTGMKVALGVQCATSRAKSFGDVRAKCTLTQHKRFALLRVQSPSTTRVTFTLRAGANGTYAPLSGTFTVNP